MIPFVRDRTCCMYLHTYVHACKTNAYVCRFYCWELNFVLLYQWLQCLNALFRHTYVAKSRLRSTTDSVLLQTTIGPSMQRPWTRRESIWLSSTRTVQDGASSTTSCWEMLCMITMSKSVASKTNRNMLMTILWLKRPCDNHNQILNLVLMFDTLPFLNFDVTASRLTFKN